MSAPFKLNGCTLTDEPHPYLEQAHAVLCCLEKACRAEDWPLNQAILAAAADAAQTLVLNAASTLRDLEDSWAAHRGEGR